MLVDLSIALNDEKLFFRYIGKRFIQLLPKLSAIVILDLDIKAIIHRRPNLKYDRRLEVRLEQYRVVATAYSIQVVENTLSREQVNSVILEQFLL